MKDNSLDIQDYLEATSDASSRTRNVTLVLVVASVIVLTGVLNSLRSNWMLARIQSIHISKNYTDTKYPPLDTLDFKSRDEYYKALKIWKDEIESFKDEFAKSATKAFVDNSLYISVPFFGIKFDVNDLGLFAGISFCVILILLNFCLTREVNNLNLSFEAAKKLNQLQEFYTLLAMRQVFTVPQMKHLHRSQLLIIAPKIICWLPFIVYLGLLFQDLPFTFKIGEALRAGRNLLSVGYEIIFFIIITYLSRRITIRLIRIDKIWQEYSPKEENLEN